MQLVKTELRTRVHAQNCDVMNLQQFFDDLLLTHLFVLDRLFQTLYLSFYAGLHFLKDILDPLLLGRE